MVERVMLIDRKERDYMNNGFTIEDLKYTMDLQRKYGQKGNDPKSMWLLRKRSVNMACSIIQSFSDYEFSEFEAALFFYSNDPKVTYFLRAYEGQLELALIHPEIFTRDLDAFYRKMCFYIEENHLYRDFFDFCAILEQKRRMKIREGHKKVFDAYTSLVMQQVEYFCRNRLEDSVAGVTLDGELIFRKNPHPFSDVPSYEIEDYLIGHITGRHSITSKMISKAYGKYGYSIHGMEEIELFTNLVNVYDNNNYILVPYIDEHNLFIRVDVPYQHHMPIFPRCWKETGFYKDKLKLRNYMLPPGGVTVEYANAGDIEKIMFSEVIHNEQVVMLYHVFTKANGEYAGFYSTKNQVFFSIFENTNASPWHLDAENFLLENYMMLTCNYDIDRKKNYAIQQVDNLEKSFHYPYQPLARITYQSHMAAEGSGTGKPRRYDKLNYQEEVRERDGMIRQLPAGRKPSAEAVQYARNMGYDLPPGRTFVRPYQYRVYCKIRSKQLD